MAQHSQLAMALHKLMQYTQFEFQHKSEVCSVKGISQTTNNSGCRPLKWRVEHIQYLQILGYVFGGISGGKCTVYINLMARHAQGITDRCRLRCLAVCGRGFRGDLSGKLGSRGRTVRRLAGIFSKFRPRCRLRRRRLQGM